MNEKMEILIEYIKNSNKDDLEIPICAAIFVGNKLLSISINKKEQNLNPIDHAEIIVINEACNKMKKKYLDDCEIYVTVEPCLMCYGAIKEARIKKIFFGLKNQKFGFSNHILMEKNKIIIESGIKEEKIKLIMQNFFEKKR